VEDAADLQEPAVEIAWLEPVRNLARQGVVVAGVEVQPVPPDMPIAGGVAQDVREAPQPAEFDAECPVQHALGITLAEEVAAAARPRSRVVWVGADHAAADDAGDSVVAVHACSRIWPRTTGVPERP
jgi:hypothetical protein